MQDDGATAHGTENGAPRLVDIPTLDALVRDPAKVATVSPDAARLLVLGLAGVYPLLLMRACAGPAEASARPERFLTVDDVVTQFGVTARWLYRHKRHLPHSQPSRKVLLFPEEKLRRWFAARKTG